jgi:DNA polymerase-1
MSVFPGYKAGRIPFEGRDQIEWLKAALPSFGVVQAYNEVEEADDAIATLVTGRLKEDVNVILSNDRDLLQLVTATTTVLAPSSGLRPEKLFDVDAVKEEYGVPPGKMVYFRAMSGDSSDKIPGVFRLQEKTIVHLIRTYGSIDGVFSSSLPELTKSQQEKIRASEAQVRKNVGLMALVSNLDLTFVHPMTNPEAASKHLQDVDVKVEPMLTAFFRLAESSTNTT